MCGSELSPKAWPSAWALSRTLSLPCWQRVWSGALKSALEQSSSLTLAAHQEGRRRGGKRLVKYHHHIHLFPSHVSSSPLLLSPHLT